MIAPLIALAAGASQALALADPWTGQPHGWLQLLGLSALAFLIAAADGRRALALGWLFALAWLAGSFWWLFISMHTYGGLNPLLAALAVLLLAGGLALFYALACALFAVLARGCGKPAAVAPALLFAALWTLAELARGRWLTGFPWGAIGYAHADGALAGWARWVGVYGVGFLAAWLAALPARMLTAPAIGRWRQAAALALAASVLAWGMASPRLANSDAAATGPGLSVSLLQGNIAQDEKFIPGGGVADALAWYGQQLQASNAALVVAPETAIPVLPAQLPPGYWQALRERFARPGQAALLGVPLGDALNGYTNSALGVAPGQAQGYRYDKHHLVPFGEFIPPFFRWFVRLMNIPLGDFGRGGIAQPSFAWQGERLAPNICYEDLFGEELGARFADPATAPTAFVNLSNIAWFGDTLAIDQHLAISRMRALEFERPVLRATNTGATAIIDHRGQVTRQLPRLTRGVLSGTLHGRSALTPYARWVSRAGLWPLWLLCLLIAGLAFWRRQRHAS